MKKGPDKVYGPLLANLFQKMSEEILKECGASAIRVEAQFILKSGQGELKLKTFTTPDAKTERLLDPGVPMPRGARLQFEVAAKLRSVWANLIERMGGK